MPERGYILLVLMIAVTVLLISLAAVLPNVRTEGQRDREEELLFRGNEYARAIATFHTRFNRYPMKIDDLLKETNGLRFLRHAYPDPMTRRGKWRFIHANAAGVVVDSRLLKALSPLGPGGKMGGPGGPGGATGTGFSLGLGTPGGLAGGGPGSGLPGAAAGDLGGGQATGQPPTNPSSLGPGEGGENPQGTGQSSSESSGQSGSVFSNGTVGLFIVGVASTSHKKSFRIWNKQKYYDDWEFLGIPASMSVQSGMPGMTGPGGITNPSTSGTGGMGGQPSGGFPPILGNPSTNP